MRLSLSEPNHPESKGRDAETLVVFPNISLFIHGAIGQTDRSAARHEKAVEDNLHYLAVIKGSSDPGMSLAD
jgi:hypothetical protein